jgi:hypothetical protein
MSDDMKNWIEQDCIPHKDGKIKWYAIGFQEEESLYIGEYDMTDWDKTFDEQVFPKAQEKADRYFQDDIWQVIRKDQLVDMMFNVASALHDSGDFKDIWIGKDWYDWLDEEDEEIKDGV